MSEYTIARARAEVWAGYACGAPGTLVSAIVWLSAGVVAVSLSVRQAMWVLLVGGALIHPASILLLEAMGRPGRHPKWSPLGGRYLSFQTLYGMRIYWVLGATLCSIGIVLVLARAPAALSAMTGGFIELGFAAAALAQARRAA
jgi:hypothetical protein